MMASLLHRTGATVGLLLVSNLGMISPAQAFFQQESDSLALEVRGNLRINQSLGRQAEVTGLPEALTPSRELSASFGLLRMMVDASGGEVWAAELHVVQVVSGAPLGGLVGLADGFSADEAGRFGGLRLPQYERAGTRAELSIDRAAVTAYLPIGRVVVGRQPINLATNYFFTPNDFFAPFGGECGATVGRTYLLQGFSL